jgi:hypothetical protein
MAGFYEEDNESTDFCWTLFIVQDVFNISCMMFSVGSIFNYLNFLFLILVAECGIESKPI